MYFLTTKNLGKNPIIFPKRTVEENRAPCICVAPTVFQCLLGIYELGFVRVHRGDSFYFVARRRPFRIYQTDKLGYKVGIFDRELTGERRLYRPTSFRFVGFVEESLVKKAEKLLLALDK